MSHLQFLQDSFDHFNRATDALKRAYANLEIKFANINQELEAKNRELEKTVSEKEEMRNYLDNILESLTNGVIVTDIGGFVQRVNRQACLFTGRTDTELQGKDIGALFDGLFPERHKEVVPCEALMAEGTAKIRLKGRTLEIFGSAVTAKGGEKLGYIVVLRDITRIEILEEMAKRSEKLSSMGEMAANIAHEIRNPLGSIELFASLLLKDLREKRDRDRVAQIVTSVKNMDNKISNLLLFTKTNAPRMERINVHDVLKETLFFAEQLASSDNIILGCRFTEGEPLISGDGEMLKQVFLNIILNGMQAMPDGGTLFLETRFPDESERSPNAARFIEISFTDSGVGIPEENLSKIFDPFFSTREGTSGLGLAIVHNIIEMHRGAIRVESQEGGGTVFELLLPLMEGGADESTNN
jgi:PAS domain S-box-containing protein